MAIYSSQVHKGNKVYLRYIPPSNRGKISADELNQISYEDFIPIYVRNLHLFQWRRFPQYLHSILSVGRGELPWSADTLDCLFLRGKYLKVYMDFQGTSVLTPTIYSHFWTTQARVASLLEWVLFIRPKSDHCLVLALSHSFRQCSCWILFELDLPKLLHGFL